MSNAIVTRVSSGVPENGTVPCHIYEGNKASSPGLGLMKYSGSKAGVVGKADSPSFNHPSPPRFSTAEGRCK